MYQYLPGTDIELYDIFNIIGFAALAIFNFANIKKKKELLSYATQYSRYAIENSHLKNKFLSSYIPWAVVEIFIISTIQYAFTPLLNPAFGDLVRTGVNYFGLLYFEPLILIAFCMIVGINPLKQLDIVTPAFPLAHIFARIGCFCAGCCHGAEWKYGLYNYAYDRVEFPVQLLYSGTALLIFIFLFFWRKKAKTGTLFPTYLILYSLTRFFIEFTRDDLSVQTYQKLCIIGVVVGIIELVLVLMFNDTLIKLFSKSKEEIHRHLIDRSSKKQKSKINKKNTVKQKTKKR